ncbi:MAG: ATP synthase F0 subunit B [Spirochaetaceae bacterium]|jgi:F-type H+-transporting ATPase subunit b|nr:ATP synthase F0 subunit B [Spirochaetaceae bacterium]
MNLIDFSVTFFWTILNIAILFLVLRAILFKPVTRFIKARAAKIESELSLAAKEREEVKRLMADYEARMNASNEELRLMSENSRRAAEERAGAIIAEGKAQADALVAAARKQIDAEKHAALLLFKSEAASLIMRAASRLLRREISGEDARRAAENALAELSGAKA